MIFKIIYNTTIGAQVPETTPIKINCGKPCIFLGKNNLKKNHQIDLEQCQQKVKT